jgi:putative protease
VAQDHLLLQTDDPQTVLHNGDGLCYLNLQNELVGLPINRAEAVDDQGLWRLSPKDMLSDYPNLRKGLQVNRNRDMSWVRVLEKKSAQRRIGVWMRLTEAGPGLRLTLTDEVGIEAHADMACEWQNPQDPQHANDKLVNALSKMGETIFEPITVDVDLPRAWFVPPSQLNALRRQAVTALEQARQAAFVPLPRAVPVDPPVPYPEDGLTYLANVYNHQAHDFYAKHGVKVIDSAFESHEELGEVSLMITKHCVRFSLSLCPKQAKGVTGVQGTVRAEPMQLLNGKEKLTLRFDCKPCEMHVVGKIKRQVLNSAPESPVTFYKKQPVDRVIP